MEPSEPIRDPKVDRVISALNGQHQPPTSPTDMVVLNIGGQTQTMPASVATVLLLTQLVQQVQGMREELAALKGKMPKWMGGA